MCVCVGLCGCEWSIRGEALAKKWSDTPVHVLGPMKENRIHLETCPLQC